MGSLSLPAILDAVYAAGFDQTLWPAALQAVADGVGGRGTLLLPFDAQDAMSTVFSDSIGEACTEYEKEWWQYDSRNHATKQRGIRRAHDLTLLSEEQIRHDPFYQDFLRRHNCQFFTAQLIKAPGSGTISVSVQGSRENTYFSDHQNSLFDALVPHVARAFSITTKLIEAHRMGAEMAASLDRFSCGVVFLNIQLKVRFVSSVAQAIMGDGLIDVCGYLTTANPRDQQRLDSLIKSASPEARGLSGAPVAISRPSGRRPLVVEAVPIRPRPDERLEVLTLGPGGVMLLIHDLDKISRGTAEAHLISLGLTRAEARVAHLVGTGSTIPEVARELGISELTVRSHLKRCYGKLDIKGQTELAIIVTKLTS